MESESGGDWRKWVLVCAWSDLWSEQTFRVRLQRRFHRVQRSRGYLLTCGRERARHCFALEVRLVLFPSSFSLSFLSAFFSCSFLYLCNYIGDVVTLSLDCNKHTLTMWINDTQLETLPTLQVPLWPWGNHFIKNATLTLIDWYM